MVVICYASGIKGYDRRRPQLSNAPLIMKSDIDSIKQYSPSYLHKLRERESSDVVITTRALGSIRIKLSSLELNVIHIRFIVRDLNLHLYQQIEDLRLVQLAVVVGIVCAEKALNVH